MGFLFNLILIAIFVYVVYRVLVNRNVRNKDPYKKDDTETHENSVPKDKSVQKKIDMSEVEDADYKEID
jgi:hypothetical protein